MEQYGRFKESKSNLVFGFFGRGAHVDGAGEGGLGVLEPGGGLLAMIKAGGAVSMVCCGGMKSGVLFYLFFIKK